MLLHDLVTVSGTVGATRSRNAKVAAISAALHAAKGPREIELVASYLAGTLPQRRIGIGVRSISRTVQASASPTVDLFDVDDTMQTLAQTHGAGSATMRRQLIDQLFGQLTPDEQTFVRGLIAGEVRNGALDGVMLKAISDASGVAEAAVRRAVMLAGFTGPVAAAAMSGGAAALAEIHLVPGRPLRPMLAGSMPSVAEAMSAAVGPVRLDCKLDGIRIQAHKRGAEITLFTRSLEDITDRLPEVVDAVRAVNAESVVLDGEAIALRPDGSPFPFQVTGARTASSKEPEVLRAETPVTAMFFDLLHLDGDDLIDTALDERLQQLAAVVPADSVVPGVVTEDAAVAQAAFDGWVQAGHEGVVVKDLRSPYAAGRRGAGWIKVKPRHTLDLVVLAVEHGSGRRTGTLSNIHLGARDGDGFTMLGKTFKGMTDEMLAWQTTRFTELATSDDGWVVQLRPEQVVEIAFDGLQRSSRYPGGIALRFARVLRYRDDKRAAEADTIQTVLQLADPGTDE